MDTEPTWVLRESLASRKAGVPVYFREWTAIGPMATRDLSLAVRFVSQREAMRSPAYSHALSFYEPIIDPPAPERS